MRTLALLTALLAGLLFMERSQEPSKTEATATHRPLVGQSERESLRLVGFSITDSGGRHEYRHNEGGWRCVSAFDAVGEVRQITDLTSALLSQTAVWRAPSSAPGAMSAFGFDVPLRIEFSREGAGSDPLTFLLGARVRSIEGAAVFVRREGVDGIWEIDSEDLAPWLTQPDTGMPPLLDQRLTAGCPLYPGRGVARAFIDFEADTSLELQPESSAEGVSWVLSDGDTQAAVLPYRLAGWLAFLQRAPYAGFANPQTASQRGLDVPAARVTLFPPDAAAIELVLGQEVEGEVYLLNKTSGMLLLLPKGWSSLVAPTARALTVAEGPNPWENWLR